MTTFVQETVQGLRALADFIEANPGLPWDPTYWELGVYGINAEDAAAFARSTGTWDKIPAGSDGELLKIQRSFGPIKLGVFARRDEVCEKVVVGTETVAIPDPVALAAVPTVEVEREVVEWKCRPLLATEVA